VLTLGGVSLLNDAASEMIAPLLPIFLSATLGAGPAIIGLIEGLAETTAAFLKLHAGRLVDRGWRHRPLVIAGYGLSNLARPLIAFATSWMGVLVLRFLDRVGKGLRTSPRDTLIADAVDADQRGHAFGFHRAMDHGGATLGPLVAAGLLALGVEMRSVFLISMAPGVLLMGLLWWGVPRRAPMQRPPAPVELGAAWRLLDLRVRGLVLAAGMLAFATVPDALLVLWVYDAGITLSWIPLVWAAAHAVRSVTALLGGRLSDRLGRLPVVLLGWTIRVAALVLIALAGTETWLLWALFIAYAASTAFTEGPERALIGDAVSREQQGTAFGLYHLLVGLFALPGAFLIGILWQVAGRPAAFLTAAALTTSAAIGLMLTRRHDG
jgi:MFS family permease